MPSAVIEMRELLSISFWRKISFQRFTRSPLTNCGIFMRALPWKYLKSNQKQDYWCGTCWGRIRSLEKNFNGLSGAGTGLPRDLLAQRFRSSDVLSHRDLNSRILSSQTANFFWKPIRNTAP